MSKLHVYKYQGAGNDFVVVDNRRGQADFLTPVQINRLCDRRFGVGADGLMTLDAGGAADFRMRYYNADGYEGTMCGNGGRCLVAFAARMGIAKYDFTACDGPHSAEVLSREGDRCIVRLKMRDVARLDWLPDGCLLDTGSTHFVQWVDDLPRYDVDGEGKRLRWDERFPHGANVNFVEVFPDHLAVRTYERGVEAETWACGTGATASAIASYAHGAACFTRSEADPLRVRFTVHAPGGHLAVDFIPAEDGSFHDVWLTGPATPVFETDIDPDDLSN